MPPDLHHANSHRAARIERQVLESPSRVKAAHGFVERMRDDAHAADKFGRAQSGSQRIGP
jgi:hypothetical protein